MTPRPWAEDRWAGPRISGLGSIVGLAAGGATAFGSTSRPAIFGLLVLAYLGSLFAEDRRLRHQINSASTILRAISDAEIPEDMRIVLPGVLEVNSQQRPGNDVPS